MGRGSSRRLTDRASAAAQCRPGAQEFRIPQSQSGHKPTIPLFKPAPSAAGACYGASLILDARSARRARTPARHDRQGATNAQPCPGPLVRGAPHGSPPAGWRGNVGWTWLERILVIGSRRGHPPLVVVSHRTLAADASRLTDRASAAARCRTGARSLRIHGVPPGHKRTIPRFKRRRQLQAHVRQPPPLMPSFESHRLTSRLRQRRSGRCSRQG